MANGRAASISTKQPICTGVFDVERNGRRRCGHGQRCAHLARGYRSIFRQAGAAGDAMDPSTALATPRPTMRPAPLPPLNTSLHSSQ